MWLAITYLTSNVVLNSLNFYWFGKMIETVRKRFKPDAGKQGADEKDAGADGKDVGYRAGRPHRASIVLDAADRIEWDERTRAMVDGAAESQSNGDVGGGQKTDQAESTGRAGAGEDVSKRR